MKSYLLYEAGGTDKLILSETAKPVLKSGEVLVRVKAIGLNPADTIYRNSETFISHSFGRERPVILGWDIAGEIVEKADHTDEFEIGDAVFAVLQNARGYAEYVAVDVNLLARKPEHISFEEAAAAPMAGLTAWQPLVYGMRIKKGDKILIHGASGGVGHYAIQIAKHFGAEVIGTSSARNRDFIMNLGADQHIDYQTEQFQDILKDIDFVFDTVGGTTLEQSIDVTKPGGIIISILGPGTDAIIAKAKEKKVNLMPWGMKFSGASLRAFADLMAKDEIKSHIAKTYPFSEMAAAHQQVESRRTAGKIVLTIDADDSSN